MEAMDAIDKMIAELDREAKRKTASNQKRTLKQGSMPILQLPGPKRTRNQAPFSRSQKQIEKTISKT